MTEKNQELSIEEKARLINPKEINKLIIKSRVYYALGIVLGLILAFGGIAFSVYADLVKDSFLLELLGMGITTLGGVVSTILCWFGPSVDLTDIISEVIMPAALNEIFENVRYDACDHIDEKIIRETDMGFPKTKIDYVEGSNLIEADYKGIHFQVSDISLAYLPMLESTESKKITSFTGTWLICDHGKNLSYDVLISENEKIKKPSKNTILTENEKFNCRYTVRSEDEENVFYLLTPHMMEFILNMDQAAKGMTYLRFQKDGKVQIAIDSGKNLFEWGALGAGDYEYMKKRIRDQIEYIISIMDELRIME